MWLKVNYFVDNFQFNLVKCAQIYTMLKTCLLFVRSDMSYEKQ